MVGSTTPYKSILVSAFIFPIFILVNISICFKIYRKFRNNFGPVHVFILNYFGTQALQLFSHAVIQILIIFSTSHENCNEYFFLLFTNLTWYLGIIGMHMDRFAAIFWDIHYTERVTMSRAITICIVNMLTAGSLASLANIVDSQYGTCTTPEIIVYTRTTNILLDGITRIIVATVTVVVSIYVVIKKNAAFVNVVHMIPTTSIVAVSTVCRLADNESTRQIRRLDRDPNMFYQLESDIVEKTRENPTRRTDEGPMHAWLPVAEQQFTVLNETEFYLMVTNTTTMTILTLLQLSNFLPYVISGMVYHNCSMDSGECDNFIVLYRIFTLVRVLNFLVQSVVVIKRLMGND